MAMKTNGINGIGIGIANACSIQISPLRVTVTVPYLAFAWPYFILLYLSSPVCQSGINRKTRNQKPATNIRTVGGKPTLYGGKVQVSEVTLRN